MPGLSDFLGKLTCYLSFLNLLVDPFVELLALWSASRLTFFFSAAFKFIYFALYIAAAKLLGPSINFAAVIGDDYESNLSQTISGREASVRDRRPLVLPMIPLLNLGTAVYSFASYGPH